ncbi:sulfotransferase family 2 domain-containing protein [Mangrovimonas sp. ST2L15]|uniref:sulfotransferase family 2 domain-containing protein n=1 Tax=Mangrovimonas sp. ST2L15 TaxID=1645916 RepID=UPI0006B3FD7A|nr:sulfotransferase family 2 domain-containing protein [Mangrovimonas sp. ST2L15]
MAVFINYSKKFFVFTSYKVAYSTLQNQSGGELKYLSYKLNYPVFRHILKHYSYNKYLLVRNPYDRFLSLFSDKFRKQPERILGGLHTWENVHTCMFPYLGLSNTDSDEMIADKFLTMQLSELISFLPKGILLDEHFMSQKSTIQISAFNKIPIAVPMKKILRLEDQKEDFSKLTGINLGIKRNTSNSKEYKGELSKEDLVVLNRIYKEDFEQGNYQMLY